MEKRKLKKKRNLLFAGVIGVISTIGVFVGLFTDTLSIIDRFFQNNDNGIQNIHNNDQITPYPTFTDTFPYYLGNKWEYSFIVESEIEEPIYFSFTEEVKMVSTAYNGKVRIYRMERSGNILDIYCGGMEIINGNSTFWVVTNDEYVYITCDEGKSKDIAIELSGKTPDFDNNPLLNTPNYILPLQDGNYWNRFDGIPERDDSDYRWNVIGIPSVQVPSGSYKDCYLIQLNTRPDNTKQFVCPGIGLVAAEYTHNGAKKNYRLELVSFTYVNDQK